MQRNLKVNIFVLIGVAIAGFILSVSVIMSVLYNHFTEVQQSQLKMQTQQHEKDTVNTCRNRQRDQVME